MKERDLSSKFKGFFADFHPQSVTNNSVAGWPDKMLQHGNIAIFVELKVCQLTNGDFFRIPIRFNQAIWLSKWQRFGGKCFLFLGLTRQEKFVSYGILTVNDWMDWYQVPNNRYNILTFDHTFINEMEIMIWFINYLKT